MPDPLLSGLDLTDELAFLFLCVGEFLLYVRPWPIVPSSSEISEGADGYQRLWSHPPPEIGERCVETGAEEYRNPAFNW